MTREVGRIRDQVIAPENAVLPKYHMHLDFHSPDREIKLGEQRGWLSIIRKLIVALAILELVT